jgi:hypothetical protein
MHLSSCLIDEYSNLYAPDAPVLLIKSFSHAAYSVPEVHMAPTVSSYSAIGRYAARSNTHLDLVQDRHGILRRVSRADSVDDRD